MRVSNNKILQKYTNPPSHNIFTLLSEQHLFASNFSEAAYSQQLEAHLVQVGEEFQTLQDFNESILQSMTSGLLVADKDTHRILKVNRALECLGDFRKRYYCVRVGVRR